MAKVYKIFTGPKHEDDDSQDYGSSLADVGEINWSHLKSRPIPSGASKVILVDLKLFSVLSKSMEPISFG